MLKLVDGLSGEFKFCYRFWFSRNSFILGKTAYVLGAAEIKTHSVNVFARGGGRRGWTPISNIEGDYGIKWDVDNGLGLSIMKTSSVTELRLKLRDG